jgi:hypothetical protein
MEAVETIELFVVAHPSLAWFMLNYVLKENEKIYFETQNTVGAMG